MLSVTEVVFGDRVRIRETPETQQRGFAGQVGSVYGESVPSSSGVAPVIGDRGDDLALSVFLEASGSQEWFAPHLVEFVDHGGVQTMSLDGGPTWDRADDGSWHEVNSGSSASRKRRWFRWRPS